MRLFDSHCHLDDKVYDHDIEWVLKRMKEAGLVGAMIVGSTLDRSTKALSIAESAPGLYASAGIHPHGAKNCSEASLEYLVNLAKSPKVKAWGEIGLDFNRMFSPRKDQEKWFVRQLEIADNIDLPVIFHERDSNGRLLEILNRHFKKGRNGVIHCFSGNRHELEHYLDLGLYIGITGIVTIKSRGDDLRKLLPLIPTQRILIETDAPYLTPVPEKNHSRRNEPAFVRSVLFKLAEIKREDPESLAKIILENTCRLYRIDESLPQ
ncbi:MAG: TatD family hydrolase [Desulfobacterales bacterium]|nr:MAG: TatD family hydrolase [Desulfobacterales bacterium]